MKYFTSELIASSKTLQQESSYGDRRGFVGRDIKTSRRQLRSRSLMNVFHTGSLQWLIHTCVLIIANLQIIFGSPLSFPDGQSTGGGEGGGGGVQPQLRRGGSEPEAEPRVIHRQIRRLLLNCLLQGRKRRAIDDEDSSRVRPHPNRPSQNQGRFFFPVIQSTNVHVNSGGGGGGYPNYVTPGGHGSSCQLPGLPSLPNAPSLPSLPSFPSLPSAPTSPDEGDDDDDDDDTDNSNNSVIPVTEENNEKKRRRPNNYNNYNINRYLRPIYRRFTRLF